MILGRGGIFTMTSSWWGENVITPNSLKWFLGLEIARSTKAISECWNKYAIEILQDCGLLAVKPAKFHIYGAKR